MAPRYVRVLEVAAVGALLASSAFGQGKGAGAPAPSSGPGIGTTTGTTTGTRSTSPTGTPTNPNNPASTGMPRPIYLSGRVVTDDGSPLPEAATIVRVCGGSSHNEGYTDSTGNFSIQLFNEVGIMQDASEASGPMGGAGGSSGMGGVSGAGNSQSSNNTGSYAGMADRRLNNCELKANLSGFRSQSVVLAAIQPTMGTTDVGTIMLHRTDKSEEGNTVSAVSLAAPKDARRAFQKGQDLIRKQKVDDAFHEYQKAVMLYPAYATAWCELGKIEAAHQQVDIARGSFHQAIKADPKYVEPYLELSRIAMNDSNWTELAQLTGKAIELDSFDYPQVFLFDSVAHYNLHEFDPAEKSIRRAETLDSRHDFPQILYLKGMVQVQHQDYAGAVVSLRAYLKMSPDAEDAPKVREQLARAEKYVSQMAAKKPE